MQRRRYVAMAVAVITTAVVLAGCAVSGSSDEGNKGSEGTGSAGTLVVGGTERPYSHAVVEAFKEAHPDIAVEEAYGTQVVDDGTIQALLRSGKGPDVLTVNAGPSRIGALIRDGLIRSIDDIYVAHDLDSAYLPDVIQQVRAQDDSGQAYEAVEGLDVFQVYYQTAVFDDLGLEPPTTWDEFIDICDQFAAAGIDPIALGLRDSVGGGWLAGQLVQSSAGRDLMTDVFAGDASFTDPKIVAGLQALNDLVDAGYIDGPTALAFKYDEALAAFMGGQYGMMAMAQAQPLQLKLTSDVDVSGLEAFTLPAFDSSMPSIPTAGTAVSWVVNAASKADPAAIEAWMAFVSSDEYVTAMLSNGSNYVPAVASDWASFAEPPALIAQSNAELAKGVGYNPSVYLPGAGGPAWFTAIQGVVSGSMTPEEAAASVDEGMRTQK